MRYRTNLYRLSSRQQRESTSTRGAGLEKNTVEREREPRGAVGGQNLPLGRSRSTQTEQLTDFAS